MTLWSTRTINSNREKDYVVIKHKLRDINGMIHGVKFRGGYAVIDKNTKRYTELRRLPFLRNAPEYSITFLRKLKFITRSMDVKVIWGQEAYYHYMIALEKELREEAVEKKVVEEKIHVEESPKCCFRLANDKLCTHEATNSPSKYCKLHLLKDPKLDELGLNIPKRLSRDEKKVFKEKVLKKLKSL